MIVKVSNISKKYHGREVLDDVSISITKGVWGLLGKNGAGKTTFLRILAGTLMSDAGEVFWEEMDSSQKKYERGMIGYLPQEITFYEGMTVYEMLEYFCILSKIDRKKMKQEILEKLRMVNLNSKKSTKIKELSGGMKRRLGIAQALLGNPPVLLLDEPMVGLDPEERINIRNILYEIGRERIVIVSTHIIEDVQIICDGIGILNSGKLLFSGNKKEFVESVSGKIRSMEIDAEDLIEFEKKHIVIKTIANGTKVNIKYIGDEGGTLCEPDVEEAFIYWTNINRES